MPRIPDVTLPCPSLLDPVMDEANLTGETREAAGTALRATVQLEIPFR
ncbi:MAG: hypothetical protein ABFS23_07170 [Pseudomonadota bacterium]